MKECASNFIGKHDFSSFRASTCQASSPIREIYNLDINRENEFVIITIKANAFLQKMVRNIVGSMVQVGRKEKETRWLRDALKNKDRKSAGITAPPHGLCLIEVKYPEEFGISSINNYEIL
jgi:tRNA pseudouridine38-40 synthase